MKTVGHLIIIVTFLLSTWAQACGGSCCHSSNSLSGEACHSAENNHACEDHAKSDSHQQKKSGHSCHDKKKKVSGSEEVRQDGQESSTVLPPAQKHSCYHGHSGETREVLPSLSSSLLDNQSIAVLTVSYEAASRDFSPVLGGLTLRGPPLSRQDTYLYHQSFLC